MNHEESKLQQQCVAWFRAQYPHYAMLLTHPANEGNGNRVTGAIHKAEGTVAGVPDLLLFLPAIEERLYPVKDIAGNDVSRTKMLIHIHGLGIEFKTKSGSQSQSQKDFQKYFEAAGYRYEVVRNLDRFQNLIKEYVYHVPSDRLDFVLATHRKVQAAAEAKEREKFYKVIGKK